MSLQLLLFAYSRKKLYRAIHIETYHEGKEQHCIVYEFDLHPKSYHREQRRGGDNWRIDWEDMGRWRTLRRVCFV
jgi:hypothetical protein